MQKKTILGVNVNNRAKNAAKIQKLLTDYGCYIKTRIGLHDVMDDFCSTGGLLILELYGDQKKRKELEDKLKAVPGVEVKKMVFST
ncbi:MAG TPA: hypothetical protein PLN69_04720 [bacterium]|nr:hypothetical protein [bacterium]